VHYSGVCVLGLGLPDVLCKTTGHFVNSDGAGLCPKGAC